MEVKNMQYLILIIEPKRAISIVNDFKTEPQLVKMIDQKYPNALLYSWVPLGEKETILKERL